MKTCSSNLCFADRREGDTLFCSNCRIAWRELTKQKGIEFVENQMNIKQVGIKNKLNKFSELV